MQYSLQEFMTQNTAYSRQSNEITREMGNEYGNGSIFTYKRKGRKRWGTKHRKRNELLAYLYVAHPAVHLYTPNNNKQSNKTRVFKTTATCFSFLYKPLSGRIVTSRLNIPHVNSKRKVRDHYTCCGSHLSVTVHSDGGLSHEKPKHVAQVF
jgi:hypothetical protein